MMTKQEVEQMDTVIRHLGTAIALLVDLGDKKLADETRVVRKAAKAKRRTMHLKYLEEVKKYEARTVQMPVQR